MLTVCYSPLPSQNFHKERGFKRLRKIMLINRGIAKSLLALGGGFILSLASLEAEGQAPDSQAGALEQLSSSVQSVVGKVSPAIVRIEVEGYSRGTDDGDDQAPAAHIVTKSKSVASGIILESNGYIVTNAHVIEGARRVRVTLDPKAQGVGKLDASANAGKQFNAAVVGTFAQADLALLKIRATNLPILPLADSSSIQPGQLVFAIGNPEGFDNSVSMGLVSAVARQRAVDRSPAYIQTDAAINPGSSGGALVDIHGNLIGITSFIVTEGGGSEGLGFALPSALIHLICAELKTQGRFEVGDIGLRVQPITPVMATALRLARDSGLIVSDVIPGSTAEAAGIRAQDILLRFDGNPIDDAAQYATSFYPKRVGQSVELELLRGLRPFKTDVTIQPSGEDTDDLLDQVDMQKSMIKQLGIVAVTLTEKSRHAGPALRSRVGVLVAGKLASADIQTGLGVGDLIRSLNGAGVQTVEGLRFLLDKQKSGDPVVLQIERHRKLRYLAFEID